MLFWQGVANRGKKKEKGEELEAECDSGVEDETEMDSDVEER